MKCEIIRYPVPNDGGRQTHFQHVCKTHGYELTNVPGWLEAKQCPIGKLWERIDGIEMSIAATQASIDGAVIRCDEALKALQEALAKYE